MKYNLSKIKRGLEKTAITTLAAVTLSTISCVPYTSRSYRERHFNEKYYQKVWSSWTDWDEDGLSNSYERIIGTNPFYNDTDFDGLSDMVELLMGTNPLYSDTHFDFFFYGYYPFSLWKARSHLDINLDMRDTLTNTNYLNIKKRQYRPTLDKTKYKKTLINKQKYETDILKKKQKRTYRPRAKTQTRIYIPKSKEIKKKYRAIKSKKEHTKKQKKKVKN